MIKKLVLALALLAAVGVRAQTTTSVSDSLLGATGTLTVTAGETFTTADGYTILVGTKYSTAIGTNGQFSISLPLTQGAAPFNAFYYADYSTTTTRVREQWAVPSSATPVKLTAVRVLWPQAPNVYVPANQLVPPPTCAGPLPNGTTLVLRYTFPFIGWTCGPDNLGAVSLDLENPTPADAGKFQWKPHSALTLTRVSCDTDQGTVSVNFDLRTEAAPNTPGTQVLSTPLICGPTGAASQTFSAASVAGLTPVALLVTGTNGAPTIVRIYAEYQLN